MQLQIEAPSRRQLVTVGIILGLFVLLLVVDPFIPRKLVNPVIPRNVILPVIPHPIVLRKVVQNGLVELRPEIIIGFRLVFIQVGQTCDGSQRLP